MLDKIQIIIPMTGNGARFKAAGYDRLKPFIKVLGRPMIEWVVELFPGDADKIKFICRQTHLDTLGYVAPELMKIAPNANIVTIKDWQKKGPVYDIMQIASTIDDDSPVLISYCDYYMYWDYAAFKKAISLRQCDGAVPCYSGFHPHLVLDDNLYASCKVDHDESLIEIKEKFSWEADKTAARHSPGLYYFRTGALMKKYYRNLILEDLNINGEYYASLPYNAMVKEGLMVWCPVIVPYFFQWGTPRDLSHCLFWRQVMQEVEQ